MRKVVISYDDDGPKHAWLIDSEVIAAQFGVYVSEELGARYKILTCLDPVHELLNWREYHGENPFDDEEEPEPTPRRLKVVHLPGDDDTPPVVIVGPDALTWTRTPEEDPPS